MKRKRYTIEGGIHWLTGSSPALPQNRIWKDVGALCENNPIQDRDPLFILVEKDRRIPFYRDSGKMEVFKDFLPAILALPSIITKNVGDYVCQFKNESVRALLGSFLNHQQNAISLIFTLATFASGDGVY